MTLVSCKPESWVDCFFEQGPFPVTRFAEPSFRPQAEELKVNITEEKNHLNLAAQVPGWAEKDIGLEIHDDTLTLRGQVDGEKQGETPDYRMREFSHRSFVRSFHLGANIDQNQVTAKLENGILHVTLPKREEAKPKTVKVNTGN